MSKIVVLNTTGLNVSQLSHLNITPISDLSEMGIYANLINGQRVFLQMTDSFEDAVSLLKKFSQLCNGTYRPSLPTPPKPQHNPNI